MIQYQSRTRAFLRNTVSSLVLQLVTVLVGFIVPFVIIGTYGSETNGLVASLDQCVAYIQLVEAGISAAAIVQLYKPLAEDDLKKVNAIVSAAKVFYYKSGGIFTALIFALAAVYPLFFTVDGMSYSETAVLVVALGATGFLDFFLLAKYRVILSATQHNWVIQLGTILYKILYVVVVVLFARSDASVTIVYLVAIAPILIRSLVLIMYVRRKFPAVSFSGKSDSIKLEQRWDAFFLQVLGAVQNGVPIIIATFILNDLAMVSVFSIYMLIANGLQTALNSFSQGTQASFGDVIARGQSETLKKAFKEFQVLAYGVSGIACGIALALIIPFVELYTNSIADTNYVYPAIGFLAIVNVMLYHLKTPQGLLVMAAGLYHDTRPQTSIQTIILLVGSVGFGLLWGAPGILLGMCLSNIYRDIDLMVYIPKKVTHTKPSETLRFMALAALLCLLVAIPYFLLGITCVNWFQWIGSGVALGAWGIVLAVVLYYFFARDQLKGIVKRMKRLLGR